MSFLFIDFKIEHFSITEAVALILIFGRAVKQFRE